MLLLRRFLPLAAVAVLGAPISATAADTRPDPAPPVVELAPDPVPALVAVPQRTSAESAAAPIARATALVETHVALKPPAPGARPSRPRARSRHPRAPELALVDVAPLAVDTPIGLGDVPRSISGDAADLAALALLAAAGAATSGMGLAFAWSRKQALEV
jgi:hypothetical protein